jgi:hypothetical protein
MFFMCLDEEGALTEEDSSAPLSKEGFSPESPLCGACENPNDPTIASEYAAAYVQQIRADAAVFRKELAIILYDDESDSFRTEYEYTSGYNTYEDDEDNEIDDFGDSYLSWLDGIKDGSIVIWLKVPDNDAKVLEAFVKLGCMRAS